MKIDTKIIKQLRQKTGAGVMEVKRALEEARSSSKLHAKGRAGKAQSLKLMKMAEEILKNKGLARAEKKQERETRAGVVYAYVHHDGKNGAMVKLLCETDFVARTDDFKALAKELAMQVVGMRPKDVKEFLAQEYVRDPKLTIGELIKQTAGKVGENIQLAEFIRYSL
jgi:elongation factor Ts